VRAIRKLIAATDRGIESNSTRDDFSGPRIATIEISQKIFKDEWNRIKDDIEKP